MQTGAGGPSPAPTNPDTDTPAKAVAPAMGRTVLRGSFWMIVMAALTRGASFINQIVLGWVLSKGDFGVYALAISAASLASALRDGGVRQLLVQRQQEYDRLVGPVFWMALAFNTLTGLVIFALSQPLATLFSAPQVAGLMLWIALATPLSTPGAILTARLQMQMRFRSFSLITGVAAMIRYFGAIAFALAGFGPLSFVLPLPIIAVVEWALGWYFAREHPYRHSPRLGVWWSLFRETYWLVIGNFAYACLVLGANPILGFFSRGATDIVGVFFFANQIVIQIGLLLGSTLSQVFFAAFARLADEPERKRAALARSIRQIMLLISPTCLGLAVTFPPLETLIWHGKWAAAAAPVQVLGLLFPPTVAAYIALASMQARGLFRQWGLSLILLAVASLGGAIVGASLYGTALAVALYSGLGGALAAAAIVIWVERNVGMPWAEAFGTLIPAWAIASAVGVLAWYMDSALRPALHALPRFLTVGVVYSAAYVLLTRVLVPGHLREGLHALPAAIRDRAFGLLRLPPTKP